MLYSYYLYTQAERIYEVLGWNCILHYLLVYNMSDAVYSKVGYVSDNISDL